MLKRKLYWVVIGIVVAHGSIAELSKDSETVSGNCPSCSPLLSNPPSLKDTDLSEIDALLTRLEVKAGVKPASPVPAPAPETAQALVPSSAPKTAHLAPAPTDARASVASGAKIGLPTNTPFTAKGKNLLNNGRGPGTGPSMEFGWAPLTPVDADAAVADHTARRIGPVGAAPAGGFAEPSWNLSPQVTFDAAKARYEENVNLYREHVLPVMFPPVQVEPQMMPMPGPENTFFSL